MLTEQRTATTSTTTTVTEEDTLRAYNRTGRDTAAGRADHFATCPETSHARCGGAA